MRKVNTDFFKGDEPVDILSIHEWLFEQFYEECLSKGIDLDDKSTYRNGCRVRLSLSVNKISERER